MTQIISLNSQIKLIKKALKLDYLYSDRELRHMKKELSEAQEQLEATRRQQKNGFGY
jgi:hypothetical protein